MNCSIYLSSFICFFFFHYTSVFTQIDSLQQLENQRKNIRLAKWIGLKSIKYPIKDIILYNGDKIEGVINKKSVESIIRPYADVVFENENQDTAIISLDKVIRVHSIVDLNKEDENYKYCQLNLLSIPNTSIRSEIILLDILLNGTINNTTSIVSILMKLSHIIRVNACFVKIELNNGFTNWPYLLVGWDNGLQLDWIKEWVIDHNYEDGLTTPKYPISPMNLINPTNLEKKNIQVFNSADKSNDKNPSDRVRRTKNLGFELHPAQFFHLSENINHEILEELKYHFYSRFDSSKVLILGDNPPQIQLDRVRGVITFPKQYWEILEISSIGISINKKDLIISGEFDGEFVRRKSLTMSLEAFEDLSKSFDRYYAKEMQGFGYNCLGVVSGVLEKKILMMRDRKFID